MVDDFTKRCGARPARGRAAALAVAPARRAPSGRPRPPVPLPACCGAQQSGTSGEGRDGVERAACSARHGLASGRNGREVDPERCLACSHRQQQARRRLCRGADAHTRLPVFWCCSERVMSRRRAWSAGWTSRGRWCPRRSLQGRRRGATVQLPSLTSRPSWGARCHRRGRRAGCQGGRGLPAHWVIDPASFLGAFWRHFPRCTGVCWATNKGDAGLG